MEIPGATLVESWGGKVIVPEWPVWHSTTQIEQRAQANQLGPTAFDRSRLQLKPIAERQHDVAHSDLLPLSRISEFPISTSVETVAGRMRAARERGAPVLMFMGAHVLKCGLQRFVINLLERGLITHVAMNGAGPIHDYELARVGGTSESVAHYIRTGKFGLWQETGEINGIVRDGVAEGMGVGESIGRAINQRDLPHKDTSVVAACVGRGIPITVHVGIGYDIIHQHPHFDPAAFGVGSYRDFLKVCNTVEHLDGGVVLCVGSAVMGPEIFLKALSMARNVAQQEGKSIANFTTAVFDVVPIDADCGTEPARSDPRYYYRPWKTLLSRTVADGGQSFYVCGDHRTTIPSLWQAATEAVHAHQL